MKYIYFILWSFTQTIQTSATTCTASLACGGTCCIDKLQTGLTSSEIKSDPYPNNADCRWLISTSNSNAINLRFSSLSTQLNYDYVYIHTCTSSSNCPTNIGTLTGDLQDISQNTYTSNTGYLRVRLTSDASYVGSFVSSWSLACPTVTNASTIFTTMPITTPVPTDATVTVTTTVPTTTTVQVTTSIPATTPVQTTTSVPATTRGQLITPPPQPPPPTQDEDKDEEFWELMSSTAVTDVDFILSFILICLCHIVIFSWESV